MKKTVLIFLVLILTLLASLHFFAASYLSEQFHFGGGLIKSLYSLGFISIFLGYWIESRHRNSKFHFITWIGYIWLGTFFISLWVTCAALLLEVWVDKPLAPYALALTVLLSAFSVFRGLQSPKIYRKFINGPPNMKGLKAVQISDLHVGLLQHDRKWLEGVVKKIDSLDPDFLFLTGDLVEGKWTYVKDQIQPLKQAHAKLARIYIGGNHEMIHGGMIWEKELDLCGWTVLHNENRIYDFQNQKILVAGVPDRMVNRFDSNLKSDPDQALNNNEKVDYRILLAHEPSSVFDIKMQKPDILLAGHTHGGQIFPFGLLVRLVQPVVSGWKKIRGIPVFAHRGTGLWGPPMRLGTRNEIVVFEWV